MKRTPSTAWLFSGLALLLVAPATRSTPPEPAVSTTAAAFPAPEPAWRLRPPAALGFEAELLDAAFRAGARMPRLTGLLVARRGEVAAEAYWRGGAPERALNVKSVSKTILSALVGVAVGEGRIESLQVPVARYLPDYFAEVDDPRKRRITLRHLLTMTSGLETTSFHNYGAWVMGADWVEGALDRPVVAPPGSRMIYSTGSAHLMAVALGRAVDRPLLPYARERLFAPLGIDGVRWQRDPQGRYFGGNNMRLAPRDLFRFGQLYLDGGRFRGYRVLPGSWVEESWMPRATSGWSRYRYGYYWWSREAAGRTVHFAWGHGGQYLFVVPSLEMVVVATSRARGPGDGRSHRAAIHRLISSYLVPSAERGGEPRPRP